MTDSYYRDLLALYELIKAASSATLDKPTQKALADLKLLVDQAEKDSTKIDSNAQAVREAHARVDKASGWRSEAIETQLNGLQAAHVGHDRPALEYVLLMLGAENLNTTPFVKGLQKALGKGRSKERNDAAKALASSATKTGEAADSFCKNLLKPTGGGDTNPLIYSALLALRSAIGAKLPEETRRIIDNLILHLPHRRDDCGGPVKTMMAKASAPRPSPGGCYWPKCYVYSCSCSITPP